MMQRRHWLGATAATVAGAAWRALPQRAAASLAALPLLPAEARAQAAHESLPRIDDLGKLLDEVAATRRPLLLFFSTPGCPYCREVRRNYLAPRVAEGPAASGVQIREVDITSTRRFIERGGTRLAEAELAARFAVRVVPVIQLVGASLQPLGEPIVGLDRSGFFEARLQGAIDAARQTLAR